MINVTAPAESDRDPRQTEDPGLAGNRHVDIDGLELTSALSKEKEPEAEGDTSPGGVGKRSRRNKRNSRIRKAVSSDVRGDGTLTAPASTDKSTSRKPKRKSEGAKTVALDLSNVDTTSKFDGKSQELQPTDKLVLNAKDSSANLS